MSSLDCANTSALNSYMSKTARTDNAHEEFLDFISDSIMDIKDIIFELERVASNFEARDGLNYDFSEELKDELKESLC